MRTQTGPSAGTREDHRLPYDDGRQMPASISSAAAAASSLPDDGNLTKGRGESSGRQSVQPSFVLFSREKM